MVKYPLLWRYKRYSGVAMKRLITAMICGILAFLAVFTGVFGTVDKTAEDYLYHHPGNVDANIKIIKIDDKTMNKMGDFSTWNRDVYAQLIEILSVSDEVRPAVIGFDILFSNEKNEEADTFCRSLCKI